MTRRYWPAAVAVIAIFVFGSYLAYTQYLVRQIQRDAEVTVQIYAIVQRGVLNIEDPAITGNALMDLQQQLLELDLPIVVLNASGEPYLVSDRLPFKADLSTDSGRARVLEYAAELATKRPPIISPGTGEVYFGDPPLLAWLKWVPPMQVGAGVLLLLVAFTIIRADMRAERERLWSAMARELAHQMGTPLSSLAGWIEVLQLPPDERDAMAPPEKIARVMQADVERLERVSRRFELVGKPQALQIAAVPDVVRELTGYFRPRLPHLGKGIVLRTRVARLLPPIRANQVLLVWALENILKNAVDALAGRGGRISVIALPISGSNGTAPTGVRILIADNGPGIAPAVRDRIFEPGVSTKSAGWGVGLSLSRRIVEELHHGRITVQQRSGGGTVFEVTLPAART